MYSQIGGNSVGVPVNNQSQSSKSPISSISSNNSNILDKMTVQSLLSSVGIKSSNMDDILEGTIADVENRIGRLKTKLDENDNILQDEKAQLSAKMDEFNRNLKSQMDLYTFGGGDSNENLFSQLKVYRGSMFSDTKQKIQGKISDTLNVDIGLGDLSTDDSKDTFLNKLNDTRIFKDDSKETKYLSMVKDIQRRRVGNQGAPDISMINNDLKQIQQKYISELQGLLNSVGADRPYYTGVKECGIEGYQTDREEGYLQLPVIMNSSRYKGVNKTTYLHHDIANDSYIGVDYSSTGDGGVKNSDSLRLSDVQSAVGNGQPVEGTPIIRTRGSNKALFVNQEDGSGSSHNENDFKLTHPINLGENEINKTQKDSIVKQQTIYGVIDTPPDVSIGTGKTVRSIIRGNGTFVEIRDPRKCLAGLIPFDETLFTNLINEKSGGLIQNINSLMSVTDTPIKWRGEDLTIQRGKNNSLYNKLDDFKTRKEIFPLLKKGLTDTSEPSMIKVLELNKLCEDFAKEVLKCNDGQGDGWEGLGWLFKNSVNDDVNGGDFNPNYKDNGIYRHLMRSNSQNIRVVSKQIQGVGGLQLGVVNQSISINNGGNTAPSQTRGLNVDNYDNLTQAYNNGVDNLINIKTKMRINDWTSSQNDTDAERKNIAELTRRRCILFLFHFLEKAFNATWYCFGGGETGNYKVKLDPREVYKKLSDWDSVQKWWSYTSEAKRCVTGEGAVCTYRGELGSSLLPEKLEDSDCLLCFARHLFIGRGNPDANGIGCRNAWENDAKLWDIIEKYLHKFYLHAIIIKNKDIIKNFYGKLNVLRETSPLIMSAKNVEKNNKSTTNYSELRLLDEYPQDLYRNLMIQMYDIDTDESEKRYCCCKNSWSEFTGGEVNPVQCNICAVAHHFFDMPESVNSYDFRLYTHNNPNQRSQLYEKVNEGTINSRSPQPILLRELTESAAHVVSDWHRYVVSSNDAGTILDESNNILKSLNSQFNPIEKIRSSKAIQVINFDSKPNSINYGSYVVNDPNYSKKEAEYKLSWPKELLKFELDNRGYGVFTMGNPKPPSNITGSRTSHSQRHCKKGTPPYPIKHLSYKLYLKEKGPLFFDMKRIHGQAKNILINYISGWEAKKERYDIKKNNEKKIKKDIQDIKEKTKEDELLETGDMESKVESNIEPEDVKTSDDLETSDDKLKSISSLEELEGPTITSIQDAKTKQVVEFSDYKQLEDEYNRVKQEISRRNTLLEDMISSYRENQMKNTSDRTAQRIREESDNKRIMVMRAKIKELERKQKRQLNFLRVAMSNMQEKFEIYKKQEEEINQFKENERRSKLESEMNRLVANQKEKDSKHMRDLHIQNLRKKQGEYMGLSDDSLHGDYDIN